MLIIYFVHGRERCSNLGTIGPNGHQLIKIRKKDKKLNSPIRGESVSRTSTTYCRGPAACVGLVHHGHYWMLHQYIHRVQGTSDIPSHPLPVATSIRVSTPEYASSRLALPSLKGVTRTGFMLRIRLTLRWKRSFIICELFMAQVTGFGSLVLDRPLDRDYPAGSPIREVTPADDYIVDARGRTIINGVVMDPSSLSQDNPNARDA